MEVSNYRDFLLLLPLLFSMLKLRMPTHLVFKESAFDAYDYFIATYCEYKRFVVEELGTSGDNVHRHVYYDGDFPNIEALRKKLNKHRATPDKANVSIKSWNENLNYFCKGDFPIQPPKVILNEMGLTQEDINDCQKVWRSHPSQTRDKLNDKASVKDLLLDKCKLRLEWPHLKPDDICVLLLGIYRDAGITRTIGSNSQLQAMIRTVLLYMDYETYSVKIARNVMVNLFS